MTAAPIHWSAAAPANDPPTKVDLAATYAAMALAHSRAYGDTICHGPQTRESLRAAVDRHYHPMAAAFTAAAALHWWEPERINAAIEGGADVHEWTWQWLTDAGVPESVIDRLTWDLNAPDVITVHAEALDAVRPDRVMGEK